MIDRNYVFARVGLPFPVVVRGKKRQEVCIEFCIALRGPKKGSSTKECLFFASGDVEECVDAVAAYENLALGGNIIRTERPFLCAQLSRHVEAFNSRQISRDIKTEEIDEALRTQDWGFLFFNGMTAVSVNSMRFYAQFNTHIQTGDS